MKGQQARDRTEAGAAASSPARSEARVDVHFDVDGLPMLATPAAVADRQRKKGCEPAWRGADSQAKLETVNSKP